MMMFQRGGNAEAPSTWWCLQMEPPISLFSIMASSSFCSLLEVVDQDEHGENKASYSAFQSSHASGFQMLRVYLLYFH